MGGSYQTPVALMLFVVSAILPHLVLLRQAIPRRTVPPETVQQHTAGRLKQQA
jgi:hypothetical protein